MSDEPRDGGRDQASAPWERPGRWAHQRMDATTVDDLIARLASAEPAAESRRQRRETADAEVVPAGELIAALTQAEPDGQPTSDDHATVQSPVTTGDEFGAAPEAPDDQAAAGQDSFDPRNAALVAATIAAPTTAAPAATAVTSAATTVTSAIDPTAPPATEPAPSSEPTLTVEPSLPAHSARAADPPGAAPPSPAPARTANNDGSHTDPIGIAAVSEESSNAQRDSILASLRRELGTEPPSAADRGGPRTPPKRRDAYGDAHRHRAWWAAGRAVVTMLAVLVLLITGTEWVIKHRADKVLADNHVSAIVPDDSNISTPTVNNPTNPTNTDAAAGNTAAPAAGNPGANKTYQAENILLMGSDARLNAEDAKLGNSKVGEDPTMQSDVLMIAHLSADRQHVTVLSLPRDLYVHAPTCKAWDYSTNSLSDQDYVSPYTEWKITNAFSVGGPQCTVKAVQELTGLKITRVIIIDFSGFKAMVDALGGITINVCRPIVDAQLGTVIATAGEQSINGTQALSLVRARKVEGDPTGDIGRIRRQQVVLSTLLRQVTKAGVLLNPGKLDSLLQAFVHNTQTDNVTLDDLIDLAQSLGNLSPSRVTFYTLPTVPEGDGEVATDIAPAVFNALVNDQPLPGEATAPATTPTTPTTVTPTPPAIGGSSASQSSSAAQSSAAPESITVAPGAVDLQVVNVTGRKGVATTTMAALNSVGFAVTASDLLLPEGEVQTGVTVEFDPSNRAAALTVAAAVPGAELLSSPGLGNQVRLMLGSSFDGTVRAVTLGQSVTTSTNSAADDTSDLGESTTTSTSIASTTSSSPTQTLTTGELGAVNAETAGCA